MAERNAKKPTQPDLRPEMPQAPKAPDGVSTNLDDYRRKRPQKDFLGQFSNYVEIHNVMDGRCIKMVDDGPRMGDPDRPNAARRRLLRKLETRGPDGGRVWFVKKRHLPWERPGNHGTVEIVQPPSILDLLFWDEKVEARHQMYKKVAAERAEDRRQERLRNARATGEKIEGE